ncbi:hypothetical protein BC937DRAFT_91733 [Endogone sp. FLAS-F59071]|nr:hypothetical protein BC937DRAFT_91733 [Endogone sp. FLAS-F59071]|eukprot:RUS15977.1 hypothetical protein BC937DRAFT_91733 [Endogone sp. FLAS-F59071]
MDPSLTTPGSYDHHHGQPRRRSNSSSFLPDSPPRLPSSPPESPSPHLPPSPPSRLLPSSPHPPSSPSICYTAVTALEAPLSPQHTFPYPPAAATATADTTTIAEAEKNVPSVENAGTEETAESMATAVAAAETSAEALAATTTATPTTPTIPTLHDFLTSLHLEHYHSACLQAGCSEDDVPLILSFDDAALKEFTETIHMRPFHDIAFRKGVRELRDALGQEQSQTSIADPNAKGGPPQSRVRSPLGKHNSFSPGSSSKSSVPPPPKTSTSDRPHKRAKVSAAQSSSSKKKNNKKNNTSLATTTKVPASRANLYRSDSALAHIEALTPPVATSSRNIDLITNPSTSSREIIIQHATIYGKNSTRALTAYEQAINSASIELALADPALIANKGALFDRAKSRLLEEGYTYKRGQSRSKLNPHAPRPGQRASKEQIRAKRNANAQSTSQERNLQIQDLERQLRAKDLEREQMEDLVRQRNAAGDMEGANEMQDALKRIESSRAEINKELSKQKGKERKHQWYEKKKKERNDSGFAEEEDDQEGRDRGDGVRDKDGEKDVDEDMDQDQDQDQDVDEVTMGALEDDEQQMEEEEDEDEEGEEEVERKEVLMAKNADGPVTADSQQQHAHQEQDDAREVIPPYTPMVALAEAAGGEPYYKQSETRFLPRSTDIV